MPNVRHVSCRDVWLHAWPTSDLPSRQMHGMTANGPSDDRTYPRMSSYVVTSRSGARLTFTGTVRICVVFVVCSAAAKPDSKYSRMSRSSAASRCVSWRS